MDAGTSTGEIIDALVRVTHGESNARTQQLFRQNLQVLVEMAKAEQRQESQIDLAVGSLHYAAGVVH